MKALSIVEPYASLIRNGDKHIETRSWKTNYRGPIMIHASSTKTGYWAKRCDSPYRGCIICRADLVDCIEMTDEFIESVDRFERSVGEYQVGRYAWVLDNVVPVEPVKHRGALGLWEVK